MVPAIGFIGKYINISEEEMNDLLRVIQTASYAKNDFILKQGTYPGKLAL